MNILYVEDDPGLGHLLSSHLRTHDHTVSVVGSVKSANQAINRDIPEILLCDYDLPDGTGLELMETVRSSHPELPCVILTGVGSESLAVSAMKAGARDYIVKDIESHFLSLVPSLVTRIASELSLKRDLQDTETKNNLLEARNRYLSTSLKKQTETNQPIGQDINFKRILKIIEQVAPTDATALISGDTGTGKEMVAQLIHYLSPRADRPCITVNCAALPNQLVESELFGHEKGAFAGAISHQIGRFEAADGGTLFLDEVGELPVELQPKLLRVLQEGTLERVGSHEAIQVDVRIIAATNTNLEKKIIEKTFREDLYYRLNVVPIHIPPLRERPADIELLFMHFVKKIGDRHSVSAPVFPKHLLATLANYDWPGNVRELSNYVERAIVTQEWGPLLQERQFEVPDDAADNDDARPLTLNELERQHILKILQRTGGVVAGDGGAAQILGINSNTLRSRMKKLNINKPQYSL